MLTSLTVPRYYLLFILFLFQAFFENNLYHSTVVDPGVPTVSRKDLLQPRGPFRHKICISPFIPITLPNPQSDIHEAYFHLKRQIVNLSLDFSIALFLKYLYVLFQRTNSPLTPHLQQLLFLVIAVGHRVYFLSQSLLLNM